MRRLLIQCLMLAAWGVTLVTLVVREYSSDRKVELEDIASSFQDSDDDYAAYLNGKRVGTVHIEKKRLADRLLVSQDGQFVLTILGRKLPVILKSAYELDLSLRLRSFDVLLRARSILEVEARGKAYSDRISLVVNSGGQSQTIQIPVAEHPYVGVGYYHHLVKLGLKPGQTATLPVFDPFGLTGGMAKVKYLGTEEIDMGGRRVKASHFQHSFRGLHLESYVDSSGRVLVVDLGLFGVRLKLESGQ